MIEKTFVFDEPQQIVLSGRTSLGTQKVTESGVAELTVTKRKQSVGFSWETNSGKEESISYTDHEVDILPREVREWFDNASP